MRHKVCCQVTTAAIYLVPGAALGVIGLAEGHGNDNYFAGSHRLR